MAKKSPSGLALMKQKNSLGANKSDGRGIQQLLDEAEFGCFEGCEPAFEARVAVRYKGGAYKITKEGKLLSLEGKEMKPFFHHNKRGPRVRIKKTVKKDGVIEERHAEVGILNLMDKYFGPYISGYSLKRRAPKSFILVSKDGNYENLAWNNLKYVNKKFYQEQGTKKQAIKNCLQVESGNLKKLSQLTGASETLFVELERSGEKKELLMQNSHKSEEISKKSIRLNVHSSISQFMSFFCKRRAI